MAVAERIGAEILSVDSMQVYRGMDIGTAKPTVEERRRVRHHMVDVAEPEDSFTVAEFRRQARRALEGSEAGTVLIVGGSGLHFRAVVDPMTFPPSDPELRRLLEAADHEALVSELVAADPEAGEVVDLANPRRVIRAVEALRLAGLTPSQLAASDTRRRYARYQPELGFAGVALDRDDLAARVDRRLEEMRTAGLLEEVERLAPRLGPTAGEAVGYRQLLDVVRGRAGPDEGFQAAKRATMRLVKRQRTFFRRDPRLRWVRSDAEDPLAVIREEWGL